MKIIIDSHEPPHVANIFEEEGFEVTRMEIKALDGTQVGDMLGDNYIIERKTEDDFWSSMVDGRLYEQMRKMAKYFPNHWKIIILEGSLANIRSAHPIKNKNWINSMRWSALQYNTFLIQVEDIYDFVDQVKMIHKKAGKEPKKHIPKQNIPKGIKNCLKVVCSLPGISLKRGEAILKTTGNLITFFNRLFGDRKNLIQDLKQSGAKTGEGILSNIKKTLLEEL